MSLLHWYGRLADHELTKATEDRIAAEIGTRDMASARPGTTTEEIAAWLGKQGFAATCGYDGEIELLRANLAQGIPTLVEWIDWGGHWVVVTGYYAESELRPDGIDTIFFADPATHWISANSPAGVTSFAVPRFRDMWFDALCLNPGQIVRRAYVTAVPQAPKL